MQHKPLDQQVVVVFGASSGIGRATALTAVKRGASVLATGRDRAALDTLAADADTDRGGRIETTIAEATDPAQAEAAAAQAVSSFGRASTPVDVQRSQARRRRFRRGPQGRAATRARRSLDNPDHARRHRDAVLRARSQPPRGACVGAATGLSTREGGRGRPARRRERRTRRHCRQLRAMAMFAQPDRPHRGRPVNVTSLRTTRLKSCRDDRI